MSEPPRDTLRSRFDRVGDHLIHARESTVAPAIAAPPVVLVHGLVISSLYMVPTALQLAGWYRVLAPDLPGFGSSSKPRRTLGIAELADALAGWLDAVGLERVALVGNSFGCQVIAELATRHAGRIHAAVLAGPTMDSAARSAPRQIGRWLVDWLQEPPSLAIAHLRDYLEAGVPRALRTFRRALRDPIETKLPALTAPTLVVRGSRDPIVPRRWAEEVTARLPHGTLREIPGGPHVVNYRTPEALAEMVRAFLAEHPAPPP